MDDFKIWFYVILGVVYLLSRLLKKKAGEKEQPKPYEDYQPESRKPVSDIPEEQTGPKRLTFEELLQEITQTKQPAPEPVSPKSEYVDYDDDLKEEEQDLEEIDFGNKKKDQIYQSYEDAKKQAFNRPSLEETLKVEDTVVKFSKFRVFEEEKGRNLLEEYTRDLQDPEGFKKALVLSEILNRRF